MVLDNRPTGSTQLFKIKARLRINTQARFRILPFDRLKIKDQSEKRILKSL